MRPKYEVSIGQTNDYRSTVVTFSIKSYLPLKEVTITMNAEPLDLVRTGKRTYQATITNNGILDIYMKNFNGMSLSEYEVINILDDGAPELVSYSADEGILTLTVKIPSPALIMQISTPPQPPERLFRLFLLIRKMEWLFLNWTQVV